MWLRRSAGVSLILASFIFVVAMLATVPPFERFREHTLYRLDPTPVRAFEYGSQYFNANDPREYNIDRAEYYFTAAAKDPSLPYVYHELARISFLKGHFDLALARINFQISLHGTSTPNSYYIRALIHGFRGEYVAAARDYETYLRTDPNNWAAINDYAWVLLKEEKYADALVALDWGLLSWPENPWLLNSRATALFELGRLNEADEAVRAAQKSVASITEAEWSKAYPGNDPLIAPEGVVAFKTAVETNMHTIEAALEAGEKNMQ